MWKQGRERNNPVVRGQNKRIKKFLSLRNLQFNEPGSTMLPDQMEPPGYWKAQPGCTLNQKKGWGWGEMKFHHIYLMNNWNRKMNISKKKKGKHNFCQQMSQCLCWISQTQKTVLSVHKFKGWLSLCHSVGRAKQNMSETKWTLMYSYIQLLTCGASNHKNSNKVIRRTSVFREKNAGRNTWISFWKGADADCFNFISDLSVTKWLVTRGKNI